VPNLSAGKGGRPGRVTARGGESWEGRVLGEKELNSVKENTEVLKMQKKNCTQERNDKGG